MTEYYLRRLDESDLDSVAIEILSAPKGKDWKGKKMRISARDYIIISQGETDSGDRIPYDPSLFGELVTKVRANYPERFEGRFGSENNRPADNGSIPIVRDDEFGGSLY